MQQNQAETSSAAVIFAPILAYLQYSPLHSKYKHCTIYPLERPAH